MMVAAVVRPNSTSLCVVHPITRRHPSPSPSPSPPPPPADELLARKAHREWLQPYGEREGAALAFMLAVRPGLTARAGALRDPAAPTEAEIDPRMAALVVSQETRAGGDAINAGRAGRGHAPLHLVVVGVVGERPDGSKLSSSELRGKDAAGGGGSSGGGGR
jgi:pantetheine-phosphate adenylyltransferase